MKKYSALLIAIFILQFSFSQTVNPVIEKIWKEKTEWRMKAMENFRNNPSHKNSRSFTENIVSASTDVESEVHAAINPTDSNNIVVSSNFVGGGFLPDRTNYIYYSNDFGSTWNTSNFITAPLTQNAFIAGGGDPNFAFTDQGKLYFSWINLWFDAMFNSHFDLFWAYSFDGGNAWFRDSVNNAIGKSQGAGFNIGAFDKQWMATDNTPSSAHYGNLYCCFMEAPAGGMPSIGVRKKLSSSNVFDTVSVQVNSATYKFIQFSSIAVDYSGNVHVSFFASVDSVTYSLYHAKSTDGGISFSAENKISDVNLPVFSFDSQTDSIRGVQASRLYPCSYIAADNTAGAHSNNLYMVWTANGISSKLSNGADVYFSRSTNGGANWSAAQVLNDNTTNLSTDQYYPAITVSPLGRVIVMWCDRRNDAQNNSTDVFLAYSNDGGQTFQPNVPVTSAATNFSTVGAANGGFGIGEYNCVLATNSFAIPVWADGRTNDGDLNLYCAMVNLDNPQVGIQSMTTINSALKISSLFPNPAQDVLNLEYETSQSGSLKTEILNAEGKIVFAETAKEIQQGKGTKKISVSNLAAGNYFLKTDFNGGFNLRKFIKE